MVFWRVTENRLLAISNVDKLGFHINEGYQIPDEYIQARDFSILRTCFGVGDWGIVSAMPRKLKEKFPDCTINIPSETFLKNVFGGMESNWSSWDSPYKIAEIIFKNNPYIDGVFDYNYEEIYHDHYRVYTDELNEPLLKQILRFWQFTEDELSDISPEIYWDEQEINFAEAIIKEHTSNKNYGTLLISNRYDGKDIDKIKSIIDKFNLPMYYWLSNPNIDLKFKKALDLRHVDIRIQMYIKSKATFNVGNQSGVNDTISNYAPTYTLPRGVLGSNYLPNQIYI